MLQLSLGVISRPVVLRNRSKAPFLLVRNVKTNGQTDQSPKGKTLVPTFFVLILLLGVIDLGNSVGFVLIKFPNWLLFEALFVTLDHSQLFGSVWDRRDWAFVRHYNFKYLKWEERKPVCFRRTIRCSARLIKTR